MIEVKELSKRYGQRAAIQNLNFSIGKGEVVGLLGPNGAGKTTTMKILTGFMAASEGRVLVDGIDIFENPIGVKKKIGYLPETPPLYGEMKVRKYLEFVAALRGSSRSEVTHQAHKAIEQTHLESVQERLIQNLSKGFRQRVGLAQALVTDPEVLVLDEPTVGLDPKQVSEIRELILDLKGQHTIILSTHILPEVQSTCEKVIIINEGQIVAEDSLEGLGKSLSRKSRIILKVRRQQQLPRIEEMEGVQGVQLKEGSFLIDVLENDMIEVIAKKVISSGAGLLEIRSHDVNLEDVFIKLTSTEKSV